MKLTPILLFFKGILAISNTILGKFDQVQIKRSYYLNRGYQHQAKNKPPIERARCSSPAQQVNPLPRALFSA